MIDIKAKVAPYTGAWIEISRFAMILFKALVAPYTGAWIEIYFLGYKIACRLCRTLHGCVD